MYTEKQLNEMQQRLSDQSKFIEGRIMHVKESADSLTAFNHFDRLEMGTIDVCGYLDGALDETVTRLLIDPLPADLKNQFKEWLQLVCEFHAVQGFRAEPLAELPFSGEDAAKASGPVKSSENRLEAV